ncbi:MAG: twin-arginine translocase subunit TatC [Nitratireductor sp.]|nr:twin-arginine translocase subunit TatC [Nitratireductor sp.]
MSADEDDIDASSAPLIEHLIELRQRLMKTVIAIAVFFVLCFIFADRIFNVLIVPYQWGAGTTDVKFIYTALEEYFFTQLKIALFGSLFISFPVIATQVYGFVAPGLYKNERRAFLPFLVATPVLFLIGSCLVYFLIMPLATKFFLSQQQVGGDGLATIENLQAVSTYLSLIMTLIFAFGLVFQLPVAITLLARVGLTSSDWLRDKRKYAIVLTFIAAAVLTPPDPISQLGLAIPALALYEVSIYMARMVERQRAQREKAEEEGSSASTATDVATE